MNYENAISSDIEIMIDFELCEPEGGEEGVDIFVCRVMVLT
jgi:hypothetical protein